MLSFLVFQSYIKWIRLGIIWRFTYVYNFFRIENFCNGRKKTVLYSPLLTITYYTTINVLYNVTVRLFNILDKFAQKILYTIRPRVTDTLKRHRYFHFAVSNKVNDPTKTSALLMKRGREDVSKQILLKHLFHYAFFVST